MRIVFLMWIVVATAIGCAADPMPPIAARSTEQSIGGVIPSFVCEAMVGEQTCSEGSDLICAYGSGVGFCCHGSYCCRWSHQDSGSGMVCGEDSDVVADVFDK